MPDKLVGDGARHHSLVDATEALSASVQHLSTEMRNNFEGFRARFDALGASVNALEKRVNRLDNWRTRAIIAASSAVTGAGLAAAIIKLLH